jgi:hypothetical protein
VYTIDNLKSDTVTQRLPWEFDPVLSFHSKEDQIKQLNDPESKHLLFSGWEGMNPHSKVCSSNGPRVCNWLVIDFDSNIPSIDAKWAQNCGVCLPQYLSRTIRGGVRLVYKLSQPVNVMSTKFAVNFLKQAQRALKLVKLFPGYDERAFLQPAQYYELGAEWREISDAEVPTEAIWGWLAKAGEYSGTFDGVEIPLDIIGKEAEKRWSGRWSGEWREGTRGVRFWDEMADNPSACVLRKTGCQTFTGPVAYMSWAQIFGREFVDTYDNDRLTRAIESFFHDGEAYWMVRPTDGKIHKISRQDVRLHLKTRCNISSKLGKDEECSDCDRAEKLVQELKFIDGAAALVYRQPGLYNFQNKQILNTCRTQVLQPANESADYGENFPFIGEFLSLMFPDSTQHQLFLAWVKRTYVGGLHYSPSQGQALFIAGHPSAGKTFLATHVLSHLLAKGVHADPTQYLIGLSNFNEELYESPLWCIDDKTAGDNEKQRRDYAERLKAAVANREFMSYGKHRKPVAIEWLGRILVTCNDDSESVRILPDLDMNNADKVIMLRAERGSGEFLDNVPSVPGQTHDEYRQRKVAEDLPHFAAWLRDWEPPKEVVGRSRFGVISYHHPDLVERVREASPNQQVAELLCLWASSRQGEDVLELNATELLADMQIDDRVKGILGSMRLGTVGLGKRMSSLIATSNFPVTKVRGKYVLKRKEILEWGLHNTGS